MMDDFNEYLREVRGWIDLSSAEGNSQDLDIFNSLALKLFSIQFTRNSLYADFCRSRKAIPGEISAWNSIPALPISAFKEFEVTILEPCERICQFHSSGTTHRLMTNGVEKKGLKANSAVRTTKATSVHYHSTESLALYEHSAVKGFTKKVRPFIFRLPGLSPAFAGCLKQDIGAQSNPVDTRWPFQLLLLTPPSSQVPHSSLVHMLTTWGKFFPWASISTAGISNQDGLWEIDGESLVSTINQCMAERKPVAVMGTAFHYVQIMEYCHKQGCRFQLPQGSCAMETGGYKGRTRILTRPELHAGITEVLGIPADSIFGEYGMCELSSQAYDTLSVERIEDISTNLDTRIWQFPPWAKARIISPETGLEAAEGETGLLQIYDLANAGSVMAIQTEDLAIKRQDGFQLVGRAPQADMKGCSLNISL